MLGVCPLPPDSRRPRLPRPPRSPWPAVVFLVLAVELCLLPLRSPRHLALPEVEGAVLVTSDLGERPVRRIIPANPDPAWTRPPCEPWQQAIQGACWARIADAKPPCPGGLYEHRGACYTPVVKGQRPPMSIHR
jgi:hypothetical protein